MKMIKKMLYGACICALALLFFAFTTCDSSSNATGGNPDPVVETDSTGDYSKDDSGTDAASGTNSGSNAGDADEPDAVSGASLVSHSGADGDSGIGEPVPIPETALVPANGLMTALNAIKTMPAGNYRIELPSGGGGPPANYDMSGLATPTTLVIDGNGYDITLAGGYDGKGSLFTIPEGITVFLIDIALYGCLQNTKSVVTIDGGTLIMKDGAKIGGNKGSPVDGGGVQIRSGTFIMDGGEISGNTKIANGGAVFIRGGGAFIMRGGLITGNQASNSGAVFMYNGGTFIMEGGEIRGNISNNYAGAVLVNNGLFEMKAGSITDNVCHLYGGGVFIGYYSHLSGGSGGIFIQSGGVISGNRSEGGGGGVSLRGSSTVFTLKGGEISGNYAVPDVKLADMYVDAISAATGASGPLEPYGGGGVFVQDGGLFEFKGGSIIGNTTTKALFGGGGILLLEKDGNDLPAMELSGGLVSGNTSSPDRGRGIYAESGKFTLSGKPSILDPVCIQYQPQADQHILIDGDFTGTTIRLDLRGNRDGIAHINNWIKPVLGITPGGAIPAAMRSRFTLGTFTPYSGGSSVNISAYSIEENGKLKR